jgi:hypothetical protein
MHEVKVYDSFGELKKSGFNKILKHTFEAAAGNFVNVQEK